MNGFKWTAAAVKKLRKAYGETQKDFCHRIGVSLGTYQGWEQGKHTPPPTARRLLDRIEEELAQGRKRPLTMDIALAVQEAQELRYVPKNPNPPKKE